MNITKKKFTEGQVLENTNLMFKYNPINQMSLNKAKSLYSGTKARNFF